MPERTCLGCGAKRSRADLVRLVARDDRVTVDPARTASGRGAWLCASLTCFDRAAGRRVFERALRLAPAGEAAGRGRKTGVSSPDGYERLRKEFADMIGKDTSGQGPGI